MIGLRIAITTMNIDMVLACCLLSAVLGMVLVIELEVSFAVLVFVHIQQHKLDQAPFVV